MAVFAVHLSGPHSEESAERLEEHYPKPHHYKLSERAYLIRSEEITETLATNIGIDGEEGNQGATGVVFKLNAAYGGFDSRSIWEWLEIAEKEST